jgi:hypothetical protein
MGKNRHNSSHNPPTIYPLITLALIAIILRVVERELFKVVGLILRIVYHN